MVLVVRSEHDRDADRCIAIRQERDHEQSRVLSLVNTDGKHDRVWAPRLI